MQGHELSRRSVCSWWEACLWVVGYQVSQLLALLIFLASLWVAVFGFHIPSTDDVLAIALETNLDRSFLLVGVTSLGALFFILPAVRLRAGPDFRSEIGWRMPHREEFIFSLAMIIPIAILGDATYEAAQLWTADWTMSWSLAAALQPSTLEYLQQTFQDVPYPILVVAMALGPAVGEELVFRGMIGRGLVQRWGIVRGVLATTFFFGMAHMSPPHAIATMPVAILLHLLYLQTRTIWLPILVHFGNNLLAVTMVRFHLAADIPLTTPTLVWMSVYLGIMVCLMEIYRRTGEIPVLRRHLFG